MASLQTLFGPLTPLVNVVCVLPKGLFCLLHAKGRKKKNDESGILPAKV